LPADQQAVIRPCVKGWPGSEGLFIPGSTDPQPFPTVPGTAQVAVTARFADGARPEDAECRFTPWQDSSRPPPYPVAAPTIVGDAGEWTIHNAAPGGWRISVTGRDFSQASAIVQVAAGDREKRVDLLLSRGGMVRGQVVSAETGEPLEGIYVSPRGTDFRTVRTDAEGRYVAEHVGVGPVQLFVNARDYVSVSADVGTVAEGGELEAAPIKLSRGGWIVGKVVPTPAPPRNLRWIGVVEPHWQDHVKVEQPASVGKDFTFRLGPLPAGVFRLDARLHTFDEVRFKIALQRWRGEVQNVRVEVGKEVTGVVILLSETPTR
jgi:hypothetical protein